MSVFESMAKSGADLGQIVNTAKVVARVRAEQQFGAFVRQAKSADERAARLSLVEDEIRQMTADVAHETGYFDIDGDLDDLFVTARAVVACDGKCDGKCGVGHEDKTDEDDDDEKEDKKPWEKEANQYIKERDGKWVITQKGTGKVLSTHDSEEEATKSFNAMEAHKHGAKTADAEDRSKDSYQHERISLPSNSTNGLGDTGAVPTDKSNSGDNAGWNLKPIDIGSKKHPGETQNVIDHAEYNSDDFDPSADVRTRVDADTTMQPQMINEPSQGGDTWHDVGTQADPVTNVALSRVLSKYQRVTVG